MLQPATVPVRRFLWGRRLVTRSRVLAPVVESIL